MRRGLLVAMLVLGLVSALDAGTLSLNFGAPTTVTTTAAQDAALVRVVADVNAERARQAPPLPAISVEDLLVYVVTNAVQTYVQTARTRNAGEACVTYQALSPADQAIVLGKLGNKSPCP